MPASVEILSIPLGSILVSGISGNDKADKNDFDVLFLLSENADLTESGVSVSAGSSIVAFEGANSVYKATVRPPQTSGIVTVSVRANAVSQGNSETRKDIRVTRFFPDADAETPTELFTFTDAFLGIATSPSRLLLATRSGSGNNYGINLKKFTYAGIEQSSEEISSAVSGQTARYFSRIDSINGDILIAPTGSGFGTSGARYTEIGGRLEFVEGFSGLFTAVTHSRLGYIGFNGARLSSQPYDSDVAGTPHELDAFSRNRSNFPFSIAHQNDLLYLYKSYPFSNSFPGATLTLAQITASDEIEVIAHANIKNISSRGSSFIDIAIYQDTLYLVSRSTTPGGSRTTPGVYTIDIRKYRPMAKNTKSTIYPVFIEAGGTLDLKQFSPDAERIVFDVGYDKPPFLTINSSNELVVGSGAQTCLVKLKAINSIDATETGSFQFYLIVRRAAPPVWREVSALTMRAGSSYDLFQLVDAESIAFRSGRARLAGSRLSNGIFTVGTEGGVAEFTARKGRQSAQIAIHIDVVSGVGTVLDVSKYRVEIEGVDVTADVLAFPSVSETLDPIVINEYRVNEAAITLRNEKGKYNSDLEGNFWETNGLNAGGFQNGVKIYIASIDGAERLLFSGVINESFEPIKEATFKLNCTDISSRLRKALAQNFGTLEKWDALRKQSDEDSYAGIYVPERSLLPMQIRAGVARSHQTDIDISQLELPSEGPAAENTGYMTPTEFRTAGGFLAENPLLRFMGEHQSEDVRFLVNQLAINKEVYNTEIDIPGVEVEDPFLLNRGSVAFSVEPTRITRLPVDWVQGVRGTGTAHNTILVLLSNAEGHIADVLVQYDLKGDSYRVLHTFEKGLSVHRIARRSGTNYYILTSKKIPQDRSARQLPRPTDATGYAYDSLAEGSEIKIYHYNTSTGTLTEHVAENDSFPPQLGVHYHIGFENGLYTDTFEGIRPEYRGAFKWHSNNLYYRYAKDGEFGVARVDTSGTTTKIIGQPRRGDWDHLNFAFDVNSAGTVYFAYLNNDAAFTVVESTNLSRRQTSATIANDLSGISAPLQLQVSIRGASVPGVNAGPYIRITGTNADGNPQTVQLSGNRLQSNNRFFSTGVVDVSERFLTITDVSVGGYLRGTFTITTAGENTALVVKRRTRDGTVSTVLTDVRILSELTVLDAIGGSYLGVLECLFHENHLYLLAPIQRLDLGEAATRTDANPTFRVTREDTGLTGERLVSTAHLNPTSTRLAPGNEIPVRIDFNGTVSGATRDDVTITGGTLGTFSISSDMIDITIRPSETRFHKNITIHLARNAVDQRNEATQIVLDFGVENSRSRNRTKSAGCVLYRVATNAASPRLEVLEKWDFVTHAACGLTVHDGSVHYVEQPRAATAFKPINPDIEGYWTDDAETETMGYNILPESLGALKKINSSGEVEALGNVWFTDRPYNVFPTRMLSIEGDLHLCAGYGNPDEVLRFNSLASGADNMVHIVYGRTLHYVLPRFSPSGSIYAALARLAKSVNATLSFEKNVIMISDRRPYRARTDGTTGTGTGDLSFSDTNKAFPSSGYLLIGKEILKYTGISGGKFTGIERGVLGSEIENHADDSQVVYLDNLIESEKLGSPYKAITLSSDTNRIFNVIRDSGGVAEVRDADSIALYGERPYTLDLGLTLHEKAWIEEIFKSYLEELKDLQQIVNIQVVADFSLRLGQIVPFFYKGLIRAMRIVSIRYERGATHLKGRTVAFTEPTMPDAGSGTGTMPDPDPTPDPDPEPDPEPVAMPFSARASHPSSQQARASAGIDFGVVETAGQSTLSRESNGYVYRLNPSISATTLTITAKFNVVFVLGATLLDLRYADSAPTSRNLRTHGTSLSDKSVSRGGQQTFTGTLTNPANGIYFWIVPSNNSFFSDASLEISGSGTRTE